jgi:hypothetical protein
MLTAALFSFNNIWVLYCTLSCCTQDLLAELIINKPADPKQYIIAAFERIKVAGTKPVLNAEDLDTMFGMFDITKRGVVAEQQASNALRTVLGQRAPKPSPAAASTAMCQQECVAYMKTSLQAATPLCKGSSSWAEAGAN